MSKICHYLDFNYIWGIYLNFSVTKERTHFLEQKSSGSYIFQSLNRRYKDITVAVRFYRMKALKPAGTCKQMSWVFQH